MSLHRRVRQKGAQVMQTLQTLRGHGGGSSAKGWLLLNLTLLIAVLASAAVLVYYQYESRRIYTSIAKEERTTHSLQSNLAALNGQKQQLSAPLRLAQMAQNQRSMHKVEAGERVRLKEMPPVADPAGAAAGATARALP